MNLPLTREQQALRGKRLETLTVPQLRVWVQACDLIDQTPGVAAKARRTWSTARSRALELLEERVPAPRWEDAWLLLALSHMRSIPAFQLAALIEASDAIQHAIPTLQELNTSLLRLAMYGLLVAGPAPAPAISRAGQRLLADAAKAGSSWGPQQKRLLELLEATRADTDTPVQRPPEWEDIAPATYASAVQDYRAGRVNSTSKRNS